MPPHLTPPDPVDWLTGRLWAGMNERHAWLGRAADQARHWKAEDAAAGMPWGEQDSTKGQAEANNLRLVNR